MVATTKFIPFVLVLIFISGFLYAQEEEKVFDYSQKNEVILLPKEYDVLYYDQKIDRYVLREKVGDTYIGEPIFLTKEGYIDFVLTGQITDYFLEKSRAYDEAYRKSKSKKKKKYDDVIGVLPSFKIRSKWFETIFGSDKIEFLPSGFASFDLGIYRQFIDNPNILPDQRTDFSIDINPRIQFGINAKIGERITLKAIQDTKSLTRPFTGAFTNPLAGALAGAFTGNLFSFENLINLKWTSDEDDIVQNVEFGNVTFPLSTNLITGVQSLIGVKTDFKLGRTNISAVASNQKSQSTNIQVQGGQTVNTYKLNVVDYDLNQHYFMGQYFRNKYDGVMQDYPIIKSPINITKAEVWKIDYSNANLSNQRAIIGIRDLGEEDANTNPKNAAVYDQILNLGSGIRDQTQVRNLINEKIINGTPYKDGEHFVVHRKARKLAESEYKINPQTGYISLEQALDDKEMLAIAYQYNMVGSNNIFQVGEFSVEQQGVLVVKLLKSNSIVDTTSPLWDLMMKNVYSIGNARNLLPENFIFNIKFQSPTSGVVDYFLSGPLQGKRFLNIFHLDRLNANNQPTPNNSGDGFFDFIQGLTINPTNGKIYFTKTEPFGSGIESLMGGDTTAISEYVFHNLYRKQKIEAKTDPLANRYFIDGKYKGTAGDGISLGAVNVPKGSVKATANGQELVEGTDYIVDYQLGQVVIINQALKNSNTPINVTTENNASFNLQKKNFFGVNVEHKFSEDFILGATFANYGERPLTQKAQYGTESLSNSIFGTNVIWKGNAPFLSKLAGLIPWVKTEGKSSIQINAEAAYLIPGTKSTIQDQSYIDDFESTKTKINLKNAYSWKLATQPQFNPLFPNGNSLDNLNYGHQRGLLSWYEIDPLFYSTNSGLVETNAVLKNLSRRVEQREIYSNRQFDINTPSYLTTFDLSFFPNERGPYNFNPNTESPQDRWGGLTSSMNVTNFESANVQYLEFWLMNPFSDGGGSSGDLLIHLGNVSEDVLYDNQLLYENGLPSGATNTKIVTTNWGTQPSDLPILYSFTTQGTERSQQDIGYDGLTDESESSKFGFTFINPVTGTEDPSGDNFLSYLDGRWNSTNGGGSIIDRYKYFQGTEGNSPSDSNIQANYLPDVEDINGDFNLDQTESYYEYRVKISPSDLNTIGSNYLVDKKTVTVNLPNGSSTTTEWYQLRIPIAQGTPIGGINGFTSMRYMRMIMKGFSNQTTLRFGSLELVRGDWVNYTKKLFPATLSEGVDDQNISDTEISVANIEENANRTPPYVVPPGIVREQLSSSTSNNLQQNEQSLSIRVNNFSSDARGVFKKSNFDVRRYKRLKMFVHAEDFDNPTSGNTDSDMRVFIRLGTDLVDNYYEYEVALKYTPNSATGELEIWPDQNTIDFALEEFISAKTHRDKQTNAALLLTQRFEQATADPNKKIYVKGRPSLGILSNIMIGVRNISTTPKNVLVWVNELRLAEIESRAAYAAQSNINFNLADLANFNLSGKYSSVGFGSITQGPTQRSQEENITYTISTNLNAEKFFPKNWNLTIPVSYSYGQNIINPEYNPIDTDVRFKDIVNSSIKEVVQQVQTNQTIAITNAKKNPSPNKKAKPAFYDIENVSTSFSYSNTLYRDIQIQSQLEKQLSLILNYNYSPQKKEIFPFKKILSFIDEKKSKNLFLLGIIKDFNFSPKPSQISITTGVNRSYNETSYRDVAALLNNIITTTPVSTVFGNRFLFNWQYALTFDLTRSFKLDYQTNTQSLINNNLIQPNDKIIWDDLLDTGNPIDHSQTVTASYNLPIQKIKALDWTTLNFNYVGNYNWRNISQIFADANLGYIIQNKGKLTTNAQLDFNRFYPRFFKKIKIQYDSIAAARRSVLDELKNKLESAKSKTAYNNLLKKKTVVTPKFKPQHYLYSLVSSVKNFTLTHSIESGSTLPGFLLEPSLLGLTDAPPSLNYIIGAEFDIKRKALEQGWVTTSNLLTSPYQKNFSQTINATALVEPFQNIKINVGFNNTYTESSSQFGFNSTTNNGVLGDVFNNQLISYNTSYLSIGTAFRRESVFNNFTDIAKQISQRIGAGGVDTDTNGFIDGFGLTNAAVLIPAFESAVKGQSVHSVGLKYRKNIPLPNWSLNYSGLTSIPFLVKRFEQITLRHSYQSNYIISGIQSNPNYFAFQSGTLPPSTDGSNNQLDANGNFHNEFLFQAVSLTETFSPLLGLDLKLKNRIQLTSQYNRGRITTLGLTNYTITQDFMDEIVLGAGYTLKDLKLNLKFGRRKVKMMSDMLLRADFSVIRKHGSIYNFLTESKTITSGQDIYSIKFSTDYNPAKNLMLKLFYNQMITKYNISALFPSNILRAGINITFSIVNQSDLDEQNKKNINNENNNN